MTTYSAPTRDMNFVINELAGLSDINQFPGLEDATVDLVGAILDEASRMASEVLDPINQTGDQTGAKIIDGEVHTVDGFGDAYQAFVEAGWPALPFDQVDSPISSRYSTTTSAISHGKTPTACGNSSRRPFPPGWPKTPPSKTPRRTRTRRTHALNTTRR